jgi:hypothetical protein
MFDWIKKILSDNCGNLSSMRVINMLIAIVILFNWTYINMKTGVLTPFDTNTVILILGGIAGKTFQKSIEEKNDCEK